MLVILKETTRKLGVVGDVVKVKRGFARNFLLPNKKAIRATDDNLKNLESERMQINKQKNSELASARKLASSIEAIDVLPIFARVESGKLFGSVGSKQIIDALKERDISIASKNLLLSSSIKEAGEHTIKVFLYVDVTASFKIHILDVSKKKEEELE